MILANNIVSRNYSYISVQMVNFLQSEIYEPSTVHQQTN